MSKKKFLRKLHFALLLKFTPEEIHEIITDYDDFIETAIKEGKSETEIYASLGDVKSIASELATVSETQHKLKKFLNSYQIRAYIGAMLFVFLTTYELFIRENKIIPFVTSAIVFNILFGISLPVAKSPKKTPWQLMVFFHTTLLLMVGGVYLLLLNFNNYRFFSNVPIAVIGTVVSNIILSCSFITLVIAMLAFHKLHKCHFGYLSIIFCATTSLIFFSSISFLLKTLDSFSAFVTTLHNAAFSYFITTCISIALLFVFKHFREIRLWKLN